MSETCSGTIFSKSFSLENTADEDAHALLGVPVPGFSIRVVNEEDQDLPAGELGDLQVRGPAVFHQYLGNPEETEASFTTDGWFRTGDRGTITEDGLTLTGRSKDVIILNGINYGCHEIEAAIEDLDGVMSSFTAAVPCRLQSDETERLAVLFAPAVGPDAVGGDLLRRIQKQVASKVGCTVEFLIPVEPGEIPKSNIGKIQRSPIRKRVEGGEYDDRIILSDLALANHRTLPGFFFARSWTPRTADGEERGDRGGTLVLFSQPSESELLTSAFEKEGYRVITVEPGASFQCDGGARYFVDPGSREDFHALAGALTESGLDPDVSVLLWPVGSPPEGSNPQVAAQWAQTHGPHAIIHWTMALSGTLKGTPPRHRLIVGTHRAEVIVPGDGGGFLSATVTGMAKALVKEIPGLDARVVDFDTTEPTFIGSSIVAELVEDRGTPEVAYRDGVRLVPVLSPIRPKPRTARTDAFVRGGRYVILGGLGSIGREMARRLVEEFDAHLLLVGRTPEQSRGLSADPDPSTDVHATLASLGSQASFAALDFANADSLTEAVERQEGVWGRPLDGVVHVADDAEPKEAAYETEHTLRRAFRAKVLGMEEVSRFLQKRPDCDLITFSSVSSIFGGAGLGAYSGANRALESATRALAYRGNGRRVSIAWPIWRLPVAGSDGWEEVFRKNPSVVEAMIPLSPVQGWNSLLAALACGEPQVVAGLNGNSPLVRRHLSEGNLESDEVVGFFTRTGDGRGERPHGPDRSTRGELPLEPVEVLDRFGTTVEVRTVSVSDLPIREKGYRVSARELAAASRSPGRRPRDPLEEVLTAIWASVLELESPGIDEDFLALGGTSLLATQLVAVIRAVFRVDLGVHTLFEHPSIAELAPVLRAEGARDLSGPKMREVLAILEGRR
jgi:NAD(P)-dependent dehydrogenase (short-subunit alcohol dehydrogenase family)